MFTGIVEGTGLVAALEPRGGDQRLRLDASALPLEALRVGDSVAVNGVCLTVAEKERGGFSADLSRETLECTTLGELSPGRRTNLERAATPESFLGGHIVNGHVDGTGRVAERRPDGRSLRVRFEAPAAILRYVAAKGSICVDGVSLTVNAVGAGGFEVNLIPHTLERTTLGELAAGRRVNLEVDVVARYVERLLEAAKGQSL